MGLSEKESTVYLSLLEAGESKVQEIARRTRLLRQTVYVVLESLKEKGIVSHCIKSGIRHFRAAGPRKLEHIMEERHSMITSVIPELERLSGLAGRRPSVETYEGREGLKTILNGMFTGNPKEIMVFGAQGRFEDEFNKLYVSWQRKRAAKGIILRIIYTEEMRKRRVRNRLELSRMRFIPEKYNFPSTTILYADKVAIILWSGDPLAILIEGREIAESYRSYFRLHWSAARE